MKIQYTKMHGLGNNYIYINLFNVNLEEKFLPQLAQDVSNVNTGIGSDGMILITPSKKADVGMRIFNKDGSEGKNCGNGLRCVAKYAYEHRIVTKETFLIETQGGIVEAEVHVSEKRVNEITINMGAPILDRSEIPMVGKYTQQVVAEPFIVNGQVLDVTAVSMGNPHAVFIVDRIENAPLYELGPVITSDNRFPEGVNVEFIEVVSNKELHFRVWERGSGITQACGTGACAAVVAAILNGQAEKDQEVIVHLAGGDLVIRWETSGSVWMKGPAETIAVGEYYWNRED